MKLRAGRTVVFRSQVAGCLLAALAAGALTTRTLGAGRGWSPSARLTVLDGKTLFHHTWVVNDPLSPAHGDGLGPVFNERSCAACHARGGSGGSAANSKNVDLLSATPGRASDPPPSREKLSALHQGFRVSNAVVLHRFSVEPDYEPWRQAVLKKVAAGGFRSFGDFSVRHSQRNTPPLFGLGLIDAIPARAIEEAAAMKHPEYEQAHGRVSRNADGSINRFGWKAQLPTLREFVLTACAGEVGLEVPGHEQSRSGLSPDIRPRELDLSEVQCASLIQYVAALPRPLEYQVRNPHVKQARGAGRELFESIGCASCHLPKLGNVDGLYSDLLLHDMGRSLSDSGAYYGGEEPTGQLAKSAEWRTPPLWGLHDSAPYLHDGRARTIVAAIAAHGGEAAQSAQTFERLPTASKRKLESFLMSLSAPRGYAGGLTMPDLAIAGPSEPLRAQR